MSALAVQAMVPAPTQPVAASVAAGGEPDSGFAALLGQFADAAPGAEKSSDPGAAAKDSPDAATLPALQSLEAALASLAAFARPPGAASAAPATTNAGSGAAATATASPLKSALAAAAGALDAGAWDSSGKTPLKALLAADPSLGLSDFQIKTFLAAAGATPARAGATTLGTDSAWSPLDAGKLAAAVASATQGANGATVAAPAAGPQAQPRGESGASPQPARSSQAGTPSRVAAARAPRQDHGAPASAPAVAASSGSGSADSTARRDAGGSSAQSAAAAPVAAAPVVAAAAPPASVSLAQLPAFIAAEASALSADSADAPPTAAGSDTPTPKAAQAVKELQISLDPADLGEMTLKLRLSGGKLSVTISIANPQTLSAIEDDRALIAARLASGDQSLDDLVIQRQALSPSTQETSPTNASVTDSGADSSGSDSEPDASASNGRPNASPRRGAGSGFRDFLV